MRNENQWIAQFYVFTIVTMFVSPMKSYKTQSSGRLCLAVTDMIYNRETSKLDVLLMRNTNKHWCN